MPGEFGETDSETVEPGDVGESLEVTDGGWESEGGEYSSIERSAMESSDTLQAAVISNEVAKTLDTNWNETDATEQLEILQRIEDVAADAQGREPAPIAVRDLGGSLTGQWDGNEIQISPDTLSDYHTAVRTVVHEGRHAYQSHVIANPEFDVRAEAWRHNMANYHEPIPGIMDRLYLSQPVEADAWSFEGRIAQQMERRRSTS